MQALELEPPGPCYCLQCAKVHHLTQLCFAAWTYFAGERLNWCRIPLWRTLPIKFFLPDILKFLLPYSLLLLNGIRGPLRLLFSPLCAIEMSLVRIDFTCSYWVREALSLTRVYNIASCLSSHAQFFQTCSQLGFSMKRMWLEACSF